MASFMAGMAGLQQIKQEHGCNGLDGFYMISHELNNLLIQPTLSKTGCAQIIQLCGMPDYRNNPNYFAKQNKNPCSPVQSMSSVCKI